MTQDKLPEPKFSVGDKVWDRVDSRMMTIEDVKWSEWRQDWDYKLEFNIRKHEATGTGTWRTVAQLVLKSPTAAMFQSGDVPTIEVNMVNPMGKPELGGEALDAARRTIDAVASEQIDQWLKTELGTGRFDWRAVRELMQNNPEMLRFAAATIEAMNKGKEQGDA